MAATSNTTLVAVQSEHCPSVALNVKCYVLCKCCTGNALFQIHLAGPSANCFQWPWDLETDVQKAVYRTIMNIVENNYCSCTADAVDWVYSCNPDSSVVIFKYSLRLTSKFCNCSGSEVVPS